MEGFSLYVSIGFDPGEIDACWSAVELNRNRKAKGWEQSREKLATTLLSQRRRIAMRSGTLNDFRDIIGHPCDQFSILAFGHDADHGLGA